MATPVAEVSRVRTGLGAGISGVVALALLLLLYVLIRSGDAPAVDLRARSWARAHQDPDLFAVLDALKNLGNMLIVAPLLLLLASARGALDRSFRPVVFTALAVGGTGVAALVLKPLVSRAGPSGVGPPAVEGSWPSGHALTAVVAALVVHRVVRSRTGRNVGLQVGLFVVPLVVTASLVYCEHHWLTDCVAAAPLGCLIVVFATAVCYGSGDPGRGAPQSAVEDWRPRDVLRAR